MMYPFINLVLAGLGLLLGQTHGIRPPVDKCKFGICEKEEFCANGHCDRHIIENLALDRPSKQSSSYYGHDAWMANNNCLNTDMFCLPLTCNTGGCCAVTSPKQEYAWWQVDLRKESQIINITIFGRTDDPAAQRRLGGYKIFVSNVWYFYNSTVCYEHNGRKTPRSIEQIDCNAIGRFVTIYLDKSKLPMYTRSRYSILELCEVQIFGYVIGPKDCREGTCKHGGTCSNVKSGYKCTCPPDYTGIRCETKTVVGLQNCNGAPCKNGGTCIYFRSVYMCRCTEYYTGLNCEKRRNTPLLPSRNHCQNSPCKHGGKCISSLYGYQCICRPGYVGPNCERGTAAHTSHCKASTCKHGGTCIEHKRGYRCKCAHGYSGANCERAPHVHMTYCRLSTCKHGGKCIERKNGYMCRCRKGYTGNNCEHKKKTEQQQETQAPVRKTYCRLSTCKHGGKCVERRNGYICRCRQGYTGVNCERKEKTEQQQETGKPLRCEDIGNGQCKWFVGCKKHWNDCVKPNDKIVTCRNVRRYCFHSNALCKFIQRGACSDVNRELTCTMFGKIKYLCKTFSSRCKMVNNQCVYK